MHRTADGYCSKEFCEQHGVLWHTAVMFTCYVSELGLLSGRKFCKGWPHSVHMLQMRMCMYRKGKALNVRALRHMKQACWPPGLSLRSPSVQSTLWQHVERACSLRF